MINISALILAKNEEAMIEDCLKQLDFVDEIIVLDQGSRDKTHQIAKKYTDKIFTTSETSFSKNREVLAGHAKGKWLLYIDADERLDDDLISAVKQSINQDKFQAFYFPRKNIVLGKWLKHGGWYPDYVPKLFKKVYLKGWEGPVHESPKIEGEYGYIKTPLTHLTARSLTTMFEKTILWAKVEANLAYEARHPKVTIPKVLWATLREFINRYIIKLGVLDGFVGLIEAMYQGLHRAAVLIYLWEKQEKVDDKFARAKEEIS